MYANLSNTVGAPIGQWSGLTVDSTPQLLPGTIMPMVDPWWGYAEMIYFRAAGTIAAQNLVAFTPTFDSTRQSFRYDGVAAPDVANSGRTVGVAVRSMVAGEYGWAVITGLCPVRGSSNIAVDVACGMVNPGVVGTVVAGKQLLNCRTVLSGSATVVKNGVTAPVGSLALQVSNSDGWFIGVYLSGTGIAAGTTVTGIDPSGRTVTISAATTALVGTVTATYNNASIHYNVVQLNRSFLQGAIT